jgi:hypothetical protein
VFGSQVQGAILGTNPAIPANPTTSDNIPMQYDFRNVYASLLKDWFQVSDTDLRTLMLTPRFTAFQFLPIIKTAPPTSREDIARASGLSLSQNYPNPVSAGHGTVIPFTSNGSHVQLTVFDGVGREIQTLVNASVPAGSHSVPFTPENLPAGTYYVRMQSGSFQRVLPMTVDR